jgi:hypothetical protein
MTRGSDGRKDSGTRDYETSDIWRKNLITCSGIPFEAVWLIRVPNGDFRVLFIPYEESN